MAGNPPTGSRSVADLVAATRGGERRATARLLSLVEWGGPLADEVAERTWTALHGGATGDDAIPGRGANRAHVVGVTGPPGAGKSTLVAAWTIRLVERGHRPAVLAVDPSSPLTGGAILGDRVRMAEATASMAASCPNTTRFRPASKSRRISASSFETDFAGILAILATTASISLTPIVFLRLFSGWSI